MVSSGMQEEEITAGKKKKPKLLVELWLERH
jgi:hypothetical protein